MRQIASAAFAAVVAVLLATGCAPEPAPTPSPTGFASEEEAFAAAEATYRAYVDALNQVDLSDPSTFEAVFDHLTGPALADEKKSLTNLHAELLTVSGPSVVAGFYATSESGEVQAIACLDVSAVSLTDQSGASQVSPERADVYAVQLEFNTSDDPRSLRISESRAIEDSRCG